MQSFGLVRLWPALENLSERKPRGLGGIYGERVLSVGRVTTVDAVFFRLKLVVSTLGKRGDLRIGVGCCRFAPLARLPGLLRTGGFGRCGWANRFVLDEIIGQLIMRPVSLVEHGIGELARV